jgi:dynein heavy chain
MYPKPTEQRRNNETLKNEVDWWAASLKLLGNTKLLEDMLHFDRENVPEPIIMGLGKFLNDPAS